MVKQNSAAGAVAPADRRQSTGREHPTPIVTPSTLKNAGSIPQEIRDRANWVLWKYEPGNNGRETKIPYQPNGRKASSTNPRTWSRFDVALKAHDGGGFDGMGFVLDGTDWLIGWDLDNCIDTETGELQAWAHDIVTSLNSYTEITPSGTGLRVLCFADIPVNGRKRGDVEVYKNLRYVTVTGRHLPGTPTTIEYRHDENNAVFDAHCKEPEDTGGQPVHNGPEGNDLPDWELIAKAHQASNGSRFAKLWKGDTSDYASQSEADQALCNMLSFWTGRDASRIDGLFRQSGLYRDKWEREDYRSQTIQKAVNDIADTYSPGYNKTDTDTKSKAGAGGSLKPKDFTDVGQAVILVQEYGDRLLYNEELGFLVYDGKVWAESELRAQRLSQELTRRQIKEAQAELNEARKALDAATVAEDEDAQREAQLAINQANAYFKYVIGRRASSRIANTLREARPMIEIDINALDADPYLLNTPAGTVDLRTGKMRPHDPFDYCTKITAVSPGNKGKALWTDHIRTVACADTELESLLQQTAGMAAVGRVYEELLLIAYGGGRNGKSSHYGALSRAMGDYAGGLAADVLVVDNRQNKKPEFAELRGRRLVIAGELEEGRQLDAATVKRISSTDVIRAEKKYKPPFDFVPSHTTVLHTNHLPRVYSNDDGTWRRLVVIPFNAVIAQGQDIKNYADHLFAKAGEAILSWIIDGATQFIANGHRIELPEQVRALVEDYRRGNDWFNEFLTACCEVDHKYEQPSGQLYSVYRDFCASTGAYTRSTRDFTRAVEKAGFTRRNTNKGVFVHGLRVIPGGDLL